MDPLIVAKACTFTALGSLGLIVNSVQLILSCVDRSRTDSIFNIVLRSLNISDIFASMAFLFRGLLFILGLFTKTIEFMLFLELFWISNTAVMFSLACSFMHIMFIAIQRVLAVAFPLKIKQIITKTRCYIILAMLWVVSVTLAFINYFYAGVVSSILSLIALVAGAILVITYFIICYKMMKRNVLDVNNIEMQRRHQQRNREVLLYSVAITVFFIICHYPESIKPFVRFTDLFSFISKTLYPLNPILDTCLYFLWSYYKRRKQAVVNRTPQAENFQVRCPESAL